MNIEQLYRDYGIPYATEGHKHCRPGWVNTACPYCISESGHEGLHLGYYTEQDYFVCWRCGGHRTGHTVAKLLNVNYHKALEIVRNYGFLTKVHVEQVKRKIKIKSFKYPDNITELQENHRKYLINRNFAPDRLESLWGLMGSNVSSCLDHINYKHRIIIPFEWDGKVVSFDSRDITGKATNKYQACPKDREEIEHKHILYGKQGYAEGTGIIVEGPSDVWRFGINSFATSGIKYTIQQRRLIGKLFKRVFVCFDDEPQAQKQAEKLVADLKFSGVDAYNIEIVGDPGAMEQTEADYFVRQLLK